MKIMCSSILRSVYNKLEYYKLPIMPSSKLNKVETGEHSFLEHGDVPYAEVNGSQELTILESLSSMQKNIETFQRENLLKIQSLELQSKSDIQSQGRVESKSIETDLKRNEEVFEKQCNCKPRKNGIRSILVIGAAEVGVIFVWICAGLCDAYYALRYNYQCK